MKKRRSCDGMDRFVSIQQNPFDFESRGIVGPRSSEPFIWVSFVGILRMGSGCKSCVFVSIPQNHLEQPGWIWFWAARCQLHSIIIGISTLSPYKHDPSRLLLGPAPPSMSGQRPCTILLAFERIIFLTLILLITFANEKLYRDGDLPSPLCWCFTDTTVRWYIIILYA